MRIEAHLEKVDRFERVRGRLDPSEDFELWYWMSLSAGTAIVNAALHVADLTDENNRYATQVPDVYAVSDQDGWHHELAARCDLIHVGLPPLDGPLPPAIVRAFAAMELIERYRDPCIRGEHPVTPRLVDEIDEAYRRCREAAREAIGERGKVAR